MVRLDRMTLFFFQISSNMDVAIQSSDKSVTDVTDLAARHQALQTDFIKNENRVNSAREASRSANGKASSANDVLYGLNNEFKNVSMALKSKSDVIGNGKDLAVDLQKRANELANSASNKLASISDVEKELEETERRLLSLSQELGSLNCEMMVHLQILEDKSNYFRTCSPPASWEPTQTCVCRDGISEPECQPKTA